MSSGMYQTVLDVKMGDVISKYSRDKVTLLGSYLEKDSKFVDNLELVITPGDGSPTLITKLPYSGYDLQLFLGDFNGDNKDEIMVRGSFGGSGGYAIAEIYDYKAGRLIGIFNPDKFSENYKVIARYLDGYKVLVNSITLNEYFIYDISHTPKEYLNMIYDENGKVISSDEPTISAINDAFPIKLISENNYYLFIRQRIIGVSNADTIGYVESFVDLLNNNMKVVQMGYYNFGLKGPVPTPTNRTVKTDSLEDKFPVGSTLIPINELGWDNDEIKIDLDYDGNDECLVPYTLDGCPYLGLLRMDDSSYSLEDSFKGEGYTIKDLIIKNMGEEYHIFLGFKIDDNIGKLHILTYRKGKLVKAFKDDGYYYSKIYLKDLDFDGKEELILWTHDSYEAYNIHIYSIKEKGLKSTNKYDRFYYKEVIDYYTNLLEKDPDFSIYLYYLALAYMKSGDFKNAIAAVDKALEAEDPYPATRALKSLRRKATRHIK
ncbi:tetratricopeptide repeat protein [Clostridium sp. Marseille-Q2269]|uniref:tetratricopeptide repeat protein n=1 Tax=Clostridium sp. Marseille-Q2269 TaxID=2942205 RepID=UPI0020733BA8|nr:tetratricopeptide repeat protein [Clostridium sp. Marseille-Q2269]